ncbi:MAG: hypothetical protein HQL68_08705 [Magnetococcales bacterium]|nr:hypothetical protein [Magnetococcales bacterium]
MSGAILVENDLRFDFTRAIKATHIDKPNRAESECSAIVDFIVELPEELLYIEVKDPGNVATSQEDFQNFFNKFKSKELSKTLAKKCRDTFFSEYVMDHIEKPIYFIAIVEFGNRVFPRYTSQIDKLKKCLFIDKLPQQSTNHRVVKNGMIMDVDAWNMHSKLKQFPISRINTTSNQL